MREFIVFTEEPWRPDWEGYALGAALFALMQCQAVAMWTGEGRRGRRGIPHWHLLSLIGMPHIKRGNVE
jgi:hypothetical protein